MSEQTTDERVAAREAERQRQRRELEAADFDGPHEFHSGDVLAAAFGTSTLKYAICLQCGAMVRLDDPMEHPMGSGSYIERGIRLHRDHHGGIQLKGDPTP